MSYADPEVKKEYSKKYWAENKERLSSSHKEYYRKNRENLLTKQREYQRANAEKAKEYQIQYRESFLERYVINRTKARAKKQGILFDLDENDIKIPTHCPVLGLELKVGDRVNNAKSPSIDKIIPELGYVKGNIQVISNKANMMKNDATPEELRMFARWVLKTFPEESDGKT